MINTNCVETIVKGNQATASSLLVEGGDPLPPEDFNIKLFNV